MIDTMTTREVCDTYGLTRQTLHNMRKSGELPYEKLNKRTIIYQEEDVARLMKERLDQIRFRQEVQEKIKEARSG